MAGNIPSQVIVPVPDPTTLTTDQLRREITSAKELIDAASRDRHAIAETRLNGVVEAIEKQKLLLICEIEKLREVVDERFQRIDVQFVERDKRTEQLAIASSTAIAAALQAAKEAVGAQNTSNSIAIAKSESSTLESLRQLRELFLSDSKATNEKINDVKSRLDKGEGQQTGHASSWGIFLGGTGAIIALFTLVVLAFRTIH